MTVCNRFVFKVPISLSQLSIIFSSYTSVNPFSPTLFLIVAKVSPLKHSSPYWSNLPFNFLTFGHSGAQF